MAAPRAGFMTLTPPHRYNSRKHASYRRRRCGPAISIGILRSTAQLCFQSQFQEPALHGLNEPWQAVDNAMTDAHSRWAPPMTAQPTYAHQDSFSHGNTARTRRC